MKFFTAYWPALLWLIVITVLSTGPGVPMPKFNLFSGDKIAHAAAYGLLAWLLLRGYRRARREAPDRRTALVIFAAAAGYGILMEFVQGAFFPNRFFEFDDMIANALGAILPLIRPIIRSKNTP